MEVAQVERLQRMLDDHLLTRRRPRDARSPIDHVEQFTERHGRGMAQIRPLVPSRIRDHEVVSSGQDRVEQQLAVLAAPVAISDLRIE